jgi:hypothetical protein
MYRCIHDSKMSDDSSCGSQTRNYSIRLRKIDGESIQMNGTLPCDAIVHDLANDIVRQGHAQAGSFKIVLQGLPSPLPRSMTFELRNFQQRLDGLGLFTTRMNVILEELDPNQRAFAENFRQLCGWCESRYKEDVILRALRQTDGYVEAAANLLLDQAAMIDQVLSVSEEMPKNFLWGQKVFDLAEQFSVGCDGTGGSLQYSCFRDCFTNRDCFRLRSKSEFWAHVLPFHYAARSLHLTRKRLGLLQPQAKIWAPRRFDSLPHPVPAVSHGGVHGSARLHICSSAMRAKLAFGLCNVKLPAEKKEGTISKEEKMAHMIALRMCSVACCQIQVIREPHVLIRFAL